MCGIFGLIDFNNAEEDIKTLEKVSNSLSRRGPDDKGSFVQRSNGITVVMLHRRLSIIDLQSGKQPMLNESGDLVLIANGEIYNYQDLRKELISKEHNFRSKSDSEVILHAYEEYGEDCLFHLRGMFAFAIWDKKKSRLFIARDRLGKKPLFYYTLGNRKFVFASEIKALLEYGEIDREVNKKAIYQYISYGYIPAPDCAFKHIKKLEPAHYIIFSSGNIKKRRYWNLNFSEKISLNENKVSEKIDYLMKEAVKLRMISDVPVGAFTSGGVDSSIITGLMSKETILPIETYSIGFEEAELNELPYARISAKHFSCKSHEVVMKPDSIEHLEDLIKQFGEPHADSSALATYILSKQAKKRVSVVLVGEGADELFGGYKRYLLYRLGRYMMKFSFLSLSFFRQRYKRWLGIFPRDHFYQIFNNDFLESWKEEDCDKEFDELFSNSQKFKGIDGALFIDTMFFLPNDLLVKLDVSTMAWGLEARAPFLDHKLIEFVSKLPPGLKLKGFISKYILRRTFNNLLPKEILHRKKTAFEVPVNYWFRKLLKDYMRDILLSSKAKTRDYFNMNCVHKLLDDHINSRGNYGHAIWSLLVLELWYRIMVDKN